jgi:hypothetical protein
MVRIFNREWKRMDANEEVGTRMDGMVWTADVEEAIGMDGVFNREWTRMKKQGRGWMGWRRTLKPTVPYIRENPR